MARVLFRFDRFSLDPEDRRLVRDGAPVALSGRYLDALTLMVSEAGQLVPKTRFMDEVWRGVPVTDEALTQCIRTLRRQLGDEVGRPRFIETVPKHGYRFIAPVVRENFEPGATASVTAQAETETRSNHRWEAFARLGRAGMLGGAAAGVLGGLIYGFVGVSDPTGYGGGATSALMVVACLTLLVGLVGGAGVGFGIAASVFAASHRALWEVIGGAVGGMTVGAAVKMIGLDAFDLMFGSAPTQITGAPEGLVLGGAIGIGFWLSGREQSRLSARTRMALATLIAGVAGAAIGLSGGRLMAGSLASLAERFPASRLRLDHIGLLFGETGFGHFSQVVAAGVEAALFGGCVVAALRIVQRRLRRTAV